MAPAGSDFAGSPRAVAQPAPEFETLEQRGQRVLARRRRREVGGPDRQRAVGLDREQPPALRQPLARGAQVLADDTADLVGVGDDRVEAAVLREPLGGCLRADLRHAGHVVDGVAGQREEVEHLVGAHAELGDDSGFVERLVAHRVDERDAGTHQLREVLVRRRHDAVDALRRRLRRQRPDHVVGLDSVDHQQRPAVRGDELLQRRQLSDEVVGHRRPVRLVLRIPVVAEGPAWRVDDDGEVIRLAVLHHSAQHRHDPAQRARGLAARRAQVGQRMERAVEIR